MERKFPIIINRVIDGDSLDVDIVLGFGIVFTDRRVRLLGVDTPEVRTSDSEEKKYGLLAKSFVEKWCQDKQIVLVVKNKDEQDKFGRILGDLHDIEGNSLVKNIIDNYHGVAYTGQNKNMIQFQHMENRLKVQI